MGETAEVWPSLGMGERVGEASERGWGEAGERGWGEARERGKKEEGRERREKK